jgi:hypothetical protein
MISPIMSYALGVVIVWFRTVFIEKKCLELPSRFNMLSFMSVTERGLVLTRNHIPESTYTYATCTMKTQGRRVPPLLY